MHLEISVSVSPHCWDATAGDVEKATLTDGTTALLYKHILRVQALSSVTFDLSYNISCPTFLVAVSTFVLLAAPSLLLWTSLRVAAFSLDLTPPFLFALPPSEVRRSCNVHIHQHACPILIPAPDGSAMHVP